MLNSHYRDILLRLSEKEVKFLLVGAYARSETVEIEGIPVHVLSIPDLIINKRATGRTKDLADAEMLENMSGEL